MQQEFGRAGNSARERGRNNRRIALWIGIGALVVVSVLVFILLRDSVLGVGGGVGIVVLALTLVIPDLIKKPINRILKKEKQFNQGAKGEEDVAEALRQLGPGAVILHDWKSPYGNIDHIVHDKAGNIFMIETKSHWGKVTASGNSLLLDGHAFEKDFIHQAISNSLWMKTMIEQKLGVKAWITPVLVFTNAFVVPGKPIEGVYYMNIKYLSKFIQEHRGSSPAGVKLWEMRTTI